MKMTTFLSVNNGNLGAIAPKFALFTKGSKLPLNKGFKNKYRYGLRLTRRCLYVTQLPGSVKNLNKIDRFV